MAVFLAGDSVGVANPLVTFFFQEKRDSGSNGLALALFSLSFTVTKDGAPYIASTPVNVATDYIDSTGKVYFATFSTDAMDDAGEYLVTWEFEVTDGAGLLTRTTKFTLVDPAYPLVDGYAQVADLIAQGVPVGPTAPSISAAVAAQKLTDASRYIERFCQRKFYPHFEEYSLESRGRSTLFFVEPIIGLMELGYDDGDAVKLLTDSTYRVYNRHIRQNLLGPDDRESPRVEMPRVLKMPNYLPQQMFVEGYFGYTDPDGTVFGATPEQIKECTLRLAVSRLQPLYDATTGGSAAATTGPIQGEKTADQSVTYANLIFAVEGMGSAFNGFVTGDPKIDQILFRYRRPLRLGTV